MRQGIPREGGGREGRVEFMRRRDLVFACVAWGGLLAGLVWALSTQFRWVQEAAKPVPLTRPPAEDTERPEPTRTTVTGVVGTVSDDTRTAMAQELRSNPAPAPGHPRPAATRADPGPLPSRTHR
jgi:hypothetical protein